MIQQAPSWRVADSVAFTQMRELSNLVVARLALHDRNQALLVRRETLAVDGYDRAAVDARARYLADLLREVLG